MSKGQPRSQNNNKHLEHIGVESFNVIFSGIGYIKTPMTIKSFKNNNRNKFIKDRIILNRWGNTEDLVGPIIFLSSLSSSYITGADIFVDGGWNAKGL